MTLLSQDLRKLTIPDRVKLLPRDHRGYPIPWYVHRDGGTPNFRVIGPERIEHAIRLNLCWVCGRTLMRHRAFIVGPIGAINRQSQEPPMHRGCALFSAQACPHFAQSRLARTNRRMTSPDVIAVWIAREHRVVPLNHGVLFRFGDPTEPVYWRCHGQPATRKEVLRAVSSRMALLLDEARFEGEAAVQAVVDRVAVLRQYLPMEGDDDAVQSDPPTQSDAATDRGTSRARVVRTPARVSRSAECSHA